MKNLGILAGIVLLLLVFGAGSAGLLPSAPVITQTSDPNGSVAMATSEQANQLFFFIVFVIINVVGAGLTIAVLFWFLGRATANAKRIPNNPPAILNRVAAPELATGEPVGLPEKAG